LEASFAGYLMKNQIVAFILAFKAFIHPFIIPFLKMLDSDPKLIDRIFVLKDDNRDNNYFTYLKTNPDFRQNHQ
jgi:hypothetical protein